MADTQVDGIGEVTGIDPADAGHARLVLAGLALQHPCELESGNTMLACPHPLHMEDAERLRDALNALGLMPSRRRKRRLR